MTLFVNIRGTNGSGKTTTVKQVLGDVVPIESVEIALPSGKRSVIEYNPYKSIATVGGYPEGVKAGGCDRIPTRADTETILEHAALYADTVLFEGIIVSTVYKPWLEWTRAREADGDTVWWCYIDTPLSVCLARIQKRNGGKPIKEDLVRDKVRSIASTREKALADGLHVVDLDWEHPAASLNVALTMRKKK